MMMGFPKQEINQWTKDEFFMVLHLISYMTETSKSTDKEIA